jgi:hypothetical protein
VAAGAGAGPRTMKLGGVVERARKSSRPFRVTKGEKFRSKDHDPGDSGSLRIQDQEAAESARAALCFGER